MDTLYFCPSMREGGLRRSVMLCGRGLRTTHMHRPITTYFLGAKIRSISISSKYFGTFFIFSPLFRNQCITITTDFSITSFRDIS